MLSVKLYSRKDCHLCDQALEDLNSMQAKIPHQVTVIDVDGDPDLKKAYGERVPVVEVGSYHLNSPFTQQELQITLGAARRGLEQNEMIDKAIAEGRVEGYVWSRADSFSYWLSKHYLALLNILVLVYVGLPFLAPVLMEVGATGPAKLIYKGYGVVCHQLAFRSWFLFGKQVVYPRSAAGLNNLIPFSEATGISDQDLYSARQYLGDKTVGFKVALCERDTAIYLAILLFGVLYAVTGRKISGLHWIIWIVVGIVPIGLDGGTQLISQPPLSLLPYRESTPLLRALTGALFGITTSWFGYPYVEESMRESLQFLQRKLDIVKRRASLLAKKS